MKLRVTTSKTEQELRQALHDVLGHNADKLLAAPVPPPPTITHTPHWLNKDWEYIPSTEHQDSTKFKERMEMRRRAIQKSNCTTTERKS